MSFDATGYENGSDRGEDDWEGDPAIGQEIETKKDAVIFAVDMGPLKDLFESAATGSEYSRVLEGICTAMRTRIWASDGSDQTALIFYNTGKAANPTGLKGIYIAQDMGRLSAERIVQVANLSGLKFSEFTDSFGAPSAARCCSLGDVFWCCQSLFSLHANSGHQKRLFLFTSDSEPAGRDPQSNLMARTRATDLFKFGVTIDLFPLNDDIGLAKFWLDTLLVPPEEEEEYKQRMDANREALASLILRKVNKKRPLNSLDFFIGTKIRAAVQLYAHVLKSRPPPPIKLRAADHKKLRAETTWIDPVTGSSLNPVTDIQTGVNIGGLRIPLTKEDVINIKKFQVDDNDASYASGSLTLIGFVPLGSLKPQHAVGHSYFIYPHDSRIEGSSVLLGALLRRMELAGRLAVVRFIARSNSIPIFAALVPQREQTADGIQQYPPGYHLIPLPYEDDVRKIKIGGTKVVEEGLVSEPDFRVLVDKAKEVVRASKVDEWQPEQIDNFAIQRLYAGIEALALGLSEAEKVEDLVQPSDTITEKIKNSSIELNDLLNSLNLQDSKKRVASVPAEKKPKKDGADLSTDDIKEMIKNDSIASLTSDQLKAFLKSHSLPVSGAKAMLIQRIKDYLV